MNEFHLETLSLPQVRALYRDRLQEDFPPDEVKPLDAIERAFARGGYRCFGATDGAEILAYAFFVVHGRTALFDYLAVRKDLRDSGVGSRFLQALMAGPLRDWDCVLLEVDDPDAAPDQAERDHRDRRLRFYLRNGLTDTGVQANVWRVDYRILSLPVGTPRTAEEMRAIYAALYRAIMPPALCERMVKA